MLQINLGVVRENPCTTKGTIAILQTLMPYVPEVNDKLIPTVVYGDGLTCERVDGAQRAKANERTPKERLEPFVSSAQEFHKEMTRMQVNNTLISNFERPFDF